MPIVNYYEYVLKKLQYKANLNRNKSINISDDEYNLYYNESNDAPINNEPIINPDINEEPHDYSKDYFTIVSLEDDNIIKFDKGTTDYINSCVFNLSINNQPWYKKAPGEIFAILNKGDKLLIKANYDNSDSYASGSDNYHFIYSKKINIEGNIMSLIYKDDFINKTSLYENNINCLKFLFTGRNDEYGNSKSNLISAKNLILPATTLVPYCYEGMFMGCTALIEAPTLPATTLVEGCYYQMFKGCSALNYIKCLATNISAQYCTESWITNYVFNWTNVDTGEITYTDINGNIIENPNINTIGTFVKHKNMNNWPIGINGIPEGWEVIDEVVE